MKFRSIPVIMLLALNCVAQPDVLCGYQSDPGKNADSLFRIFDTRVVVRDTGGFVIYAGKRIRPLPAHIVLPDSCMMILLNAISEQFITTGKPVYLSLLDRISQFDEGYTRNYIYDVVRRMVEMRSDPFISYFCSYPPQKVSNIDQYFFTILGDESRHSTFVKEVKKWLRQNRKNRELKCYSRIRGMVKALRS